MNRRCPGATPLGTGTLSGYQFVINRRGVATLRPQPGGVVFGVIWQCTHEHIEALDQYEGVAEGRYQRDEVSIRSGAENHRRVLVYVDPVTAEGPPRLGYLDLVTGGAREHGLPRNYIEMIESWSEV